MDPPIDPRVYIDDIRRRAFTETHLQGLESIFRCQEFDSTRASVIEIRTSGKSSHTGITSLTHLITKIQELDASWNARQSPIAQRPARAQLVVVENASPDFINFLGSFYEVSPEFFVDHAAGCRPTRLSVSRRLPSQSLRGSFMHMNGIQSYTLSDLIGNAPGFAEETDITNYLKKRRHYFRRKWRLGSDKLALQLEDRTSYFVKSRGENDWIAICLIDPRLSPRKPSGRDGALRLPSKDDGWQGNISSSATSSINNAGFSLHDTFTAYLAQHFTIEEFIEDVFSPSAFLYLHLALIWNEQTSIIETELSHLSFEQKLSSNLDIVDRLSQIRPSLHYMSSSIKGICEQLQHRNGNPFPLDSNSRRESWSSTCARNVTIRSRFQDLHQDFKCLLHQTEELKSLLTSSLNLHISAANTYIAMTKESKGKETVPYYATTRHQGTNSAITKLTVLLSIYLPLIFGCVLFGMNIQQINSAGPHVAIFVAVAFGLVSFTFLAFMICRQLEDSDFGSRFRMLWGGKSGKKMADVGMV